MKYILYKLKIIKDKLKKYKIVSCENPANDKIIFGTKRKTKSCLFSDAEGEHLKDKI